MCTAGSVPGRGRSSPRRADLASGRIRWQNSSRDATTISAAADGVGARRSATKSAIVTSLSWPTAEMTGTGQEAIARATASSLKAQKIFHRAATAPDDHDVDAGHAADGSDGLRNIERGSVALHARRPDHDLRVVGNAGRAP
jgi:hypothetical protein